MIFFQVYSGEKVGISQLHYDELNELFSRKEILSEELELVMEQWMSCVGKV